MAMTMAVVLTAVAFFVSAASYQRVCFQLSNDFGASLERHSSVLTKVQHLIRVKI
jgi:hypothetical protein